MPSNPGSSPLVLPVELQIQITNRLDIEERLKLRLISRQFASSLEKDLFPGGLITVRPQNDDMDRLDAVSRHSAFSKNIKHLQLFVGDVRKSAVNSGILMGSNGSYGNQKQEVLKKFEPMFEPSRVDRHCDGQLLADIISRLPNLTTIIATSDFPFAGLSLDFDKDYTNDIEEFWRAAHEGRGPLGTGPMARGNNSWQDSDFSITRYTGILSAVQQTTLPLRRLALDPLPLECLTEEDAAGTILSPIKLAALTPRIVNLHDFRFSVKSFLTEPLALGDLRLAQQLGDFFGLMPHLRKLDLGWYLRNESPPFGSKFRETFYDNHWPHLESLRLSNMNTPSKQLINFLKKHASTLRRLHLNDETVDLRKQNNQPKPTHRAVLTALQKHLNLEKLQYLTAAMEHQIYDADWMPIVHKPDLAFLENPALRKIYVPDPEIKDAKLLELFVLGKLLWPMSKSMPVFAVGWPRLPKMDIIGKLTDKATIGDRELLIRHLEADYDDSSNSGSDEYW